MYENLMKTILHLQYIEKNEQFHAVYHKSKYLSLLSGNKTKTNSLQRTEAKVVPVWEMKFRPRKMRYVGSQQATNSDRHLSTN